MTETASFLRRSADATGVRVAENAVRQSFAERRDILSWGRVDRRPQHWACPHFRDELVELLRDPEWPHKLAIGLRRSYGDSCLNSAGALIEMIQLDRLIAFDPLKGRLRGEAGVSLSEALKIVVPRGWFLPTTPGTRFVTLGGAVANDVHGKNHHKAGSFGANVLALGLQRSDGGAVTVTPETQPDLFRATIGGLGLTGVIEWVEIALVPIASAFLDVEIAPFENLEEFWCLVAESVDSHEHTVAWIDCTTSRGRGVFTRANWASSGGLATHDDRSLRAVPFDFPGYALNRLSVGAFNELYYRLHKMKATNQVQDYQTYFYPLDSIRSWNRLYGVRGIRQYQCVIPWGEERVALPALLAEIARTRQASFLAILKTFGDKPSAGLLSFPRPGTTLALDFPYRGEETLSLMSRLDSIVREAKGALYPAKDGRMPTDMFRLSFPQWETFARLKDPAMNSDFWRRVSQ
ncbi:MAG: FAD-binding oxidoreductase [Roseiarcus sp.]